MKIAIDISPIIYETGVAWYTHNLVKNILRVDKEDSYTLFGSSLRGFLKLGKVTSMLGRNFTAKLYPFPPVLMDLIWNKIHTFKVENLTGDIDVFHSSDWTQPPTSAIKVTTIHDLVPIRYPQISHPSIVSAHKHRLKWVKNEVDKIIAVSEFTKNEIVSLLDINPNKIKVIYEAADTIFQVSASVDMEFVKKKYKLDKPYLLAVGADPRKNLPRVIKAVIELKKDLDIELVVIGKPWNKSLKGARFLGHVERQEMSAIYTGARSLVYTSVYEGFGLPILEAMMCETPVVTSNVSSMPEVAGDAAFLVDPNSSKDILLGIKGVLSNRAKWIKRGRERVKKFSWIKTAEQTIDLYRESVK